MTYYSTRHALPAPADSDPVASYASIARALVDKLDLDVVGALVTSTAGTAAAANWTVTSFRGIKLLDNRFAWVDFIVTRNAGAAVLTAAATGNIVDTDVAQVPAAFRPVRRQYASADRSSLGRWQVFVEAATGMLTITAGPPTATINPGDAIQCQTLMEIL
jgi:hypothetical protein